MFDEEAREMIRHAAVLRPGEELLWAGRPKQGIWLRAADAYLIPFSVMWGGFAIFWEVMAVRSRVSAGMAIWGIPFVLIGLYVLFGRFVHAARVRRQVAYGLTAERVIVLGGRRGKKVRSYRLDSLTDLGLHEYADGTGTIDLGSQDSWWDSGGWSIWTGLSDRRLDRVPDARWLYDKIMSLQH
jgi:hypothetical protein